MLLDVRHHKRQAVVYSNVTRESFMTCRIRGEGIERSQTCSHTPCRKLGVYASRYSTESDT